MSFIDYSINHFMFAVMMSIRLGAFFFSMPMFNEVKITPIITVIVPVLMAFLIAPTISYDIMP
ncbi:hypothetical protein BVY03_05365, partial [bacterium K02(2017)]